MGQIKPKLIVILGPTSSGKSDLAVAIALQLRSGQAAEIISADSRQVYKGLDIGSGKVPRDKAKGGRRKDYFYNGVKHHLLDVASPKRVFTVSHYKKLGEQAIKKILKQNKIPIICGGTGFYIDALVYDFVLPDVLPNPILRKKLEKQPCEELFKQLKKLDPKRAKTIDAKNKRRLIRALEINIISGKPVRTLRQAQGKMSKYDILNIGIKREFEELKELIHRRLLKRIKQGMIAEVKNLKKQGVSSKRLEDMGLEYRYVNRFLDGKISRTEMIEQLKKETFAYAKRQMTWFKRDKNIHWAKNDKEVMEIVKQFIK